MIAAGEARALATSALVAAGLAPERAHRSADLLVVAEVWGLASHGMLRLPYYLDRLAAGGIRAGAELTPVRDTGPMVTLDGGDGLGHWQAWEAAELAASRAAHHGVAAVSVGASSHCGALGLYTTPGLRHGLVSLVFSTGPAVMAAPGTATPLLSTSPLAAGVPGSSPAVVDLATSAVARGKIAAAAQRGDPLPAGWAVDNDGAPTTDARAALAGMLAPLGGGKGFAIAFLVEALTAGSVGPSLAVDVPDMFDAASNHRPQRIAHLVLTLDPTLLDVDGGAADRLDGLTGRLVAAGGRVPGGSRTMPWQVADDDPVRIPDDLVTELRRRAGAGPGDAADQEEACGDRSHSKGT
ncbi:(2R)-3-sulfolactate dehydrogenase (NADP+) [Haloactinopolyspora alba]|uniref:(2R)-3-sulfolactate dehydrogenase (NADP+) n=1 Tax=Haloactinopolyspora alba TaxID=648780 RepID=A0A2P8EG10_9ACTN|nr:Ldh family oxidoreductase [Haloactinopolyspora alba]PSL08401.1 (2R)-3-sulfolactate dehydrogenase (NADP+) [Haloactinopolyspora alba]